MSTAVSTAMPSTMSTPLQAGLRAGGPLLPTDVQDHMSVAVSACLSTAVSASLSTAMSEAQVRAKILLLHLRSRANVHLLRKNSLHFVQIIF